MTYPLPPELPDGLNGPTELDEEEVLLSMYGAIDEDGAYREEGL